MATLHHADPPGESRIPDAIAVTVSYLPASHPYKHAYVPDAKVETVRSDSMAFFHVRDRQERDTYLYYLELDNARIVDTSQTLAHLAAGRHTEHGLHFHLVEQITPG